MHEATGGQSTSENKMRNGPRRSVANGRLTIVAIALCCVAGADLAFTPPAPLNTNADIDEALDWGVPEIAADGKGNWVAVWASRASLGNTIGRDWDILVARSTGDGRNWTYPIALNTNAATDSVDDFYPTITTDGKGHWLVAWYAYDSVSGTFEEDDIFFSRSSDNGETWTVPEPLNTNALTDDASDAVPHLGTDGKGTWIAVWDTWPLTDVGYGEDIDVFIARSTDKGRTWSDPAPLNSNASTDFGDDRVPRVATDAKGSWLVVWTSNDPLQGIGHDEDILVARSADNGITWTDPVPLNSDAFTDDDLVLDLRHDSSPQLATDGNGVWVAVWWFIDQSFSGSKGSDVQFARSTDNGATWSKQATLTADLGTGRYPSIATDGNGNWTAIWTTTVNLDYDVYAVQSTDDGVTWSYPVPIKENPMESKYDDYAGVFSDGTGHWVMAWQSKDSLGGTIGNDNDILFVLNPIPAGSLTLLTPNGGEAGQAGTQQTISWSSSGNLGADVRLELRRKGNVIEVIQESTPNDGSHIWDVPSGLRFHRRYSIAVTSVQDASIEDLSDAPFRIKDQAHSRVRRKNTSRPR